jgi:ubiquitin-conjugating enzyme E2 O
LPADIPGPSYFPSYSWKSLGTYHTGTVPPAYLNGVLGAVEEEDYAYDEDELSNYLYNSPPMEYGGSFDLNADHYMGFPPIGGSYLPREHVAPSDLTQQQKQVKIVESEVDEHYKAFKQFDTVGDHSDHFYLKFRAVKKVAVCTLGMLYLLCTFSIQYSLYAKM